jgi:hypothetical protein
MLVSHHSQPVWGPTGQVTCLRSGDDVWDSFDRPP